MKNFPLLRKDLIINLNKQIKLALLTLILGLLIIFFLSLLPNSFGDLLSKYLIIISIIYGVIVIIVHFILLFNKADKDPYNMLTFSDMSIIFTAKTHQDEFPIVGLAYIEMDSKSYPPGIMLTFIYDEHKKISVLIHSKQYESFVYLAKEFNIHFEERTIV